MSALLRVMHRALTRLCTIWAADSRRAGCDECSTWTPELGTQLQHNTKPQFDFFRQVALLLHSASLGRWRPFLKMAAKCWCTIWHQADKVILVGYSSHLICLPLTDWTIKKYFTSGYQHGNIGAVERLHKLQANAETQPFQTIVRANWRIKDDH